MIHQVIFAAPRPGWSASEFQEYWLKKHSRIAGKIPQILAYSITAFDTALDWPAESASPFKGCAEIILRNEAEQLASLESPEFIDGARRDEPHWAAFWLTLALDTARTTVMAPQLEPGDRFKLFVLLKRKEGQGLAAFQRAWTEEHSQVAARLPGLQGYQRLQSTPGGYTLGEPRFDGVEALWFSSLEEARAALREPAGCAWRESLQGLARREYLFAHGGKSTRIELPRDTHGETFQI